MLMRSRTRLAVATAASLTFTTITIRAEQRAPTVPYATAMLHFCSDLVLGVRREGGVQMGVAEEDLGGASLAVCRYREERGGHEEGRCNARSACAASWAIRCATSRRDPHTTGETRCGRMRSEKDVAAGDFDEGIAGDKTQWTAHLIQMDGFRVVLLRFLIPEKSGTSLGGDLPSSPRRPSVAGRVPYRLGWAPRPARLLVPGPGRAGSAGEQQGRHPRAPGRSSSESGMNGAC